ncbi:MAG: dihydroorotate dehydrogenase B catalytic subunit [Bacteroidetes bacterium GWF2_38_335]|nr:MAG: dihydroorotate dehydrogenase B catalytic subunit [Bacteroidetes bacterium GWF2_38_335]OFY81820.1 MAG: dihydroorotate dehydrogenase B catalytic subunit [Bacteroidetes bacterium RIFOXYA12_FULL_38_20]HBS87893.1 dihydroorotate dehydrogenase [Bacteroidales bacterium]
MVNLNVKIGDLVLQNPVMTASGTYGYGPEFDDFVDNNKLGGIFVKGTTLEHREGNNYPRMAETPSGMLNAVGLQNKGVDYFCKEIYPVIRHYNTHIFVNVSGSKVDDYVKTAERVGDLEDIPGIELNISCPNVKEGGMAFGTSCSAASEVIKAVRKVYKKTLIVKLSPNVTDITQFAQIAENEGAEAISLINTLLGIAIDAKKQKPVLSTITGGLSGPAIKPVALRMVWQCAKTVKIPIIGMGGIMNATDAIEFMLAGATAVQVGTANFIDPAVTMKIIDGLNSYCIEHNIKDINDIVGLIIKKS